MPPPPPPIPGETAEAAAQRFAKLKAEQAQEEIAYRTAEQIRWYDRAREVFVAEVTNSELHTVGDIALPRVELKPLRWLKGAGSRAPITVSFKGLNSCGPYGGGDAPNGRAGNLFVVYDIPGETGFRGDINVGVNRLLDPRVIEALAKKND